MNISKLLGPRAHNKLSTALKRTPVALFLCAASLNSQAASIMVTNAGDSSGCTFRRAVENINAGVNLNNGCLIQGNLGDDDTINFNVNSVSLSSGTVDITSNLNINQTSAQRVQFSSSSNDQSIIGITNSVVTFNDIEINNVLESNDEPALEFDSSSVTLNNCSFNNNSGSEAVLDARGGTLAINDSQFTNNFSSYGGAVDTSSTIVNINRSTILGNSAMRGGGASFQTGMVSISNSRFEDNYATYGAGGLSARDTQLTIENSRILRNRTNNYGGSGLEVSGGSLDITQSIISGNSSSGINSSGGGLALTAVTATITNSEISNNSANEGAGLYLTMRASSFTGVNSSITLIGSTISNNQATEVGGGIFSSPQLDNGSLRLTIRNSTISGNSAGDSGGGIVTLNDSKLAIVSSTITRNRATSGTGGLLTAAGTAGLYNSIIAGNTNLTSSAADDALLFFTESVSANNLFGSNNLFTAESIAGFTVDDNSITATRDGTNPTSISDILGPLRRNGGPTATHALVPDSPAIDNGNFFACGFTVGEFDQRGRNRLDGNCDIGSMEFFEADDSSCFVIPLKAGGATVFCL